MTNQFRLLVSIVAITAISACSAFNPPPRSRPTPNIPSSSGNTGSSSGSSSSMKLREEIADFGKKFVGVPYKYAGQSPSTGFDCSGFTYYVMKGFGISLSPASSAQATLGKKVPLDKALPGDLLFFGASAKKIQHVALIVKRNSSGITCVHSTSSRGVMVENVSNSSYWKPKILFARNVITK